MREVERIADQLQRAWEGNAWHGPALLELLSDVSPQEAATMPIAGAHSIWELIMHVTAWTRYVERRLDGESHQLSATENFPTVTDVAESAWQATRGALDAATKTVREKILRLEDSQLGEALAGHDVSIYSLLHGLIQHDLYHAGQIALLKRALRG